MQLAAGMYQFTAHLPAAERLGLSSSLQQAAVSIPSLIAGGTKRGRSGFTEACQQARYHCAELETLLLITQQAYPTIPADDLLASVAELQAVLTDMVKRLTKPAPKAI